MTYWWNEIGDRISLFNLADCLFQIVRVKVQARLCQIHAAEKVICHLANKGLVVVD